MLDLALYELGNVLLRSLRWSADDVADQIDDLRLVLGPPLMTLETRLAAELADRHSLTFYDACWAATAASLGVTLVSADRQLLTAGLAESPTDTVARLRLA